MRYAIVSSSKEGNELFPFLKMGGNVQSPLYLKGGRGDLKSVLVLSQKSYTGSYIRFWHRIFRI